MGALGEIYIKKETLETLFKTLEKKGEKGVGLTLSISDDTNEHGQNISCYVKQSKEDREAKKPKYYVGNGGIFWENGTIKKADKNGKQTTEDDDLPF